MTRKEFIKLCGLLGIGLSVPNSLSALTKKQEKTTLFSGKVLIMGAGAGGLTAGYLLKQQGIDFEILEASTAYGGRMKIHTDFADFPIPLGAEWLETKPSIFREIVNDDSIEVQVKTALDLPDRKFVNYSWFNFFEDYIVPSIADHISYNKVVKAVDYTGDKVLVSTQQEQFSADKLIISVPLKILQEGDITFSPSLPIKKLKAIQGLTIWDGFKAFFEFSTNFYGNQEYVFPITPASKGQKLYYNAALGQNTTKNILGLFVVGAPVQDYVTRSGEDLKDFILAELDHIYEGQASAHYLQHISQNWNQEPFIRGGYLADHANWKTVSQLRTPVDRKLYFAGGAYTDGNDWVSVHTAARSAKEAIEAIYEG